MKKHYVTAICCVAMGLGMLWGAAQAAIPGLNEQALKESIRARVGSILQDNGKDASKLTLDAIRIDKAEAVDVRGIKLHGLSILGVHNFQINPQLAGGLRHAVADHGQECIVKFVYAGTNQDVCGLSRASSVQQYRREQRNKKVFCVSYHVFSSLCAYAASFLTWQRINLQQSV